MLRKFHTRYDETSPGLTWNNKFILSFKYWDLNWIYNEEKMNMKGMIQIKLIKL